MKLRGLLFSIGAGLLFGATLAAQQHVYTLTGQGSDARYGISVAPLDDLDGDGAADFLVCAENTIGRNPRGFAHLISGGTCRVIHRIDAHTIGWGYGTHCLNVGDIDGDRVSDFAISSVWEDNVGVVRIYSGAKRSELRKWRGAPQAGTTPSFGQRLCVVGDVDRDGQQDLAISSRVYDRALSRFFGRVRIISTKTGKELFRWEDRASIETGFGKRLGAPGDLDADGVPDLLVCAPKGFSAQKVQVGFVRAYSLKTGKVIGEWYGRDAGRSFGTDVCVLGDVDGDKVGDFAVMGDRGPSSAIQYGFVWLFSGKTRMQIQRVDPPKPTESNFGRLFRVPDMDSDGVDELGVAAPAEFTKGALRGVIRVYAGKTRRVLRTWRPNRLMQMFGTEALVAGDIDGDGVRDLLTADGLDSSTRARAGLVRVYSMKPRALSALEHEIDRVYKPGLLPFQLRAGRAGAGGFFLMLAGASGTKPGIRLGSLVVPIRPDPITNLFLGAGSSLYAPALGLLDSNGNGSTFFVPPPVYPTGFKGIQLWHAFVVFDMRARVFRVASNALPLRIR